MLIDFHMHTFSEKIARKTIGMLAQTSGIAPETNGTISNTIEVMDKYGIDIGVMFNIATKPTQHDVLFSFASENTTDRIKHFASVFPITESREEEKALENELLKIKSAGFRGIKLHPDYQGYMSDDRRVFKVYEICESLGLYTAFHAGFDSVSPNLIHNPPEKMAKVKKEFPKLKIIASHLGGYQMWDDAEKYLVGRDIFFDTSMSAGEISPEQFRRIIMNHGSERILYGSDCPWQSPKVMYDFIKSAGLDERAENNILYLNAEKILM